MKEYTLWFYDCNRNGEMYKAHDICTGTRSYCYKIRAMKSFSWQYKVHPCIW